MQNIYTHHVNQAAATAVAVAEWTIDANRTIELVQEEEDERILIRLSSIVWNDDICRMRQESALDSHCFSVSI